MLANNNDIGIEENIIIDGKEYNATYYHQGYGDVPNGCTIIGNKINSIDDLNFDPIKIIQHMNVDILEQKVHNIINQELLSNKDYN